VWGQGSNTNNSIKEAHDITIVTAKINSRTKDAPQTFFIGTDGSKRAEKAAAWSVSRARAGDRLVLCHIRDEERESLGYDPNTIKSTFVTTHQRSLELKKISWEVMYLPRDRIRRIADQLIAVARSIEIQATYVVIGRDGAAAMKRAEKMSTGTTSDKIANVCRCTTVVAA
jgi:nucleotide-binding universal stress UspA family protein